MYMYVCVLHVWIHCMCIFCMTAVSVAPPPLISGVSNMSNYLTLELHRAQFLFSKKLLGMATIPLYSIRHSTKVPVHLHVGQNDIHVHVRGLGSCGSQFIHVPVHGKAEDGSWIPFSYLCLSLSYLDTLPPSLSSSFPYPTLILFHHLSPLDRTVKDTGSFSSSRTPQGNWSQLSISCTLTHTSSCLKVHICMYMYITLGDYAQTFLYFAMPAIPGNAVIICFLCKS